MNADRLLRLYPRAWRERYGDELRTLVEGQRLTPRLAFDLLKGAIDAHLHPGLLPAPGALVVAAGSPRSWSQIWRFSQTWDDVSWRRFLASVALLYLASFAVGLLRERAVRLFGWSWPVVLTCDIAPMAMLVATWHNWVFARRYDGWYRRRLWLVWFAVVALGGLLHYGVLNPVLWKR